jgi:hypothetical protein
MTRATEETATNDNDEDARIFACEICDKAPGIDAMRYGGDGCWLCDECYQELRP